MQLRPYQADAVNIGTEYLNSKTNKNAFMVLPTGSGKSVVIAKLVENLQGNVLILQPSVEILKQNFQKYICKGNRASIYSASAGKKNIDRVTFATIGSILNKKDLFENVTSIIIDECHLVNPVDGMYKAFINYLPKAKVLGLTATPYRLSAKGALKFLNRTKPRIFTDLLYYVQNSVLFNSSFLSKLEYYPLTYVNRELIKINTAGNFDTQSEKRAYKLANMPQRIIEVANRLLLKRKNLLVFCSYIEEAQIALNGIPNAILLTGETPKLERETILSNFKKGIIKCVINVGVLTTGFDYPELECVLIARATMSLSLYYQMVGRAMRIAPTKESAWIVDLGGNVKFFGHIETMKIEKNDRGLYFLSNNGKQLTNVVFNTTSNELHKRNK